MCVPLFDQIRGWVFEGRLSDPHLEFFIVQQAALSGGGGGEGGWRDPWREGYRIEGAKLPPFINRWGGEVHTSRCAGLWRRHVQNARSFAGT